MQSKSTASCEARAHFPRGVDPKFAETLSRQDKITMRRGVYFSSRLLMEMLMLYLSYQCYVCV